MKRSRGDHLQVAAGERGKQLPHLQGVEDIRATVVTGGADVKILQVGRGEELHLVDATGQLDSSVICPYHVAKVVLFALRKMQAGEAKLSPGMAGLQVRSDGRGEREGRK